MVMRDGRSAEEGESLHEMGRQCVLLLPVGVCCRCRSFNDGLMWWMEEARAGATQRTGVVGGGRVEWSGERQAGRQGTKGAGQEAGAGLDCWRGGLGNGEWGMLPHPHPRLPVGG
jgi:hypothetical protein